jgi:DNA-binding response OmpR family regulator
MDELKKIKILHVDDEADTLKVVKTILEKEGYEVTSALNGTDALKQIDKNGFSLVILDIMLPGMSGWDLFTHIPKIRPTCDIIFLTIVDISEDTLKELKFAGLKDYIKKPFDNDDFVSRIKKVLAE